MPDPITTTVAMAGAARLLSDLSDLGMGVASNEAHLQVRKLANLISGALREGKLPPNHDLQNASHAALREATVFAAHATAGELAPKKTVATGNR